MESLQLYVTYSALMILVVALIAEYVMRRRQLQQDYLLNRQKQQQLLEVSQDLNRLKKVLSRKSFIADEIPNIAKKMTEKLSQEAFPAIAVRSAKDFFQARQVGYLVPVDETTDYTLEVGVGYPPDWLGKIRIKSDEGILGMAIQKKMVISRLDPLSTAGRRLSNLSLEQLNATPDFVAPIFGMSGIVGALVVAGCPYSLEEERKYFAMIADFLSAAIRNASLIDTTITRTWADHLTGVSNRLHFLQRFESEIRRTENYDQSLAMFMFDIDEFKSINDTYGHASGDQVIKKLADIVRHNTRSSDLVGRYGGDEFMVLMTSSTLEQARIYAENLREKIAASELTIPGHSAPVRLTISGGLAVYPANGISTTELLNAADSALYEAKRHGRNRIVLSQSVGLDGSMILNHGTGSTEPVAVPLTGDETLSGVSESTFKKSAG